MVVTNFPDRKIRVDGIEYLYFGGTNFLGITTNIDFQNLVFESIKKWGTACGSSRNSNVKLSIYEKAESVLAKNWNTESSVVVASGMLAGKLIVDYLYQTTEALFHFPDAHPAIKHPSSTPIYIEGQLHPKLLDNSLSKITIVTDAIPSQCVEPVDLKLIVQIPKTVKIHLVIDESNTLGIWDSDYPNYLHQENIHLIKLASLGKAMGISGAAIAAELSFIDALKKQDTFIGAAGMNPAFLETFVQAQPIYQMQKEKLLENLHFIDANFDRDSRFKFHPSYPIIYFDDAKISKKLADNRIITTSFPYTNASGILNRIVITANHTREDLMQLLALLS
jgi:8-amino-7-oxononanoate synthase